LRSGFFGLENLTGFFFGLVAIRYRSVARGVDDLQRPRRNGVSATR
jgi:hypothetical protein